MTLLTLLMDLISGLGLPVQTGAFTDEPPDTFVVLTPLTDTFDLYADNGPGIVIEEVRIALFSKSNYLHVKDLIVRSLLDNDITVSEQRFIEYESETGYYHYAVDSMIHRLTLKE